MSKYFANCKTRSELRTAYKVLLKKHHPDNGGDVTIMQEINAEYAVLLHILPDVESEPKKTVRPEKEPELSAILKAVIDRISAIPGLQIEVCGKWIWVSGNTYPVKDVLKSAGFKFSGKKKMWYFREESDTERKYWKHKETDMGTIRMKYGSEMVNSRSACLA